MDDYLLIKSNLESTGNSAGFDMPWVHRWYVIAFCFAPALLILLLSRYADAPSTFVLFGQFVLAFGTFLALIRLSDKTLINPVQSVVFLFHWWFAIGPGLAVLFAVLRDDHDMLSRYVSSGGEALWVVALGLPLYAFCAQGTTNYIRGRIRPLMFLMPEGTLYRPRTIAAYWLLGGGLTLLVSGLARLGYVGNQTINYLGGTVSENWFISALQATAAISIFATIGVMSYLAGPARDKTVLLKLIAVGLIVFNTVNAFTSGWKGAMVVSFAIFFIIMFVWRQKAPLILILLLGLFYLFIVEPFVSQARTVAGIVNITTPEERTELFSLALSRGIAVKDLKAVEVNIESPFRGIYLFAGGIAADSSMLQGPWSTLFDGLSALVPRVLYPDKPDLNMGNYFAQYLGVSDPDDYINNIGVSIPFEFVGNYGYLAGVLSFGLIGILWTVFCVWLLSEERLATHPLSPLLIISALGLEASVGQFLATIRDLPLVLGAAYGIWLLLKKQL